MGPRAGRDQAPAGSPHLTADGPLDLDEDPPRLVAGRCGGCGALTFPLRAQCPACGGAVERTLLPARGTLWTWTTQGFEPKPPYVPDDGEFEPYSVGYVEFEGYLRVEGRLTEADPERVRIGMPMEVVPLQRGDRVTYAFAPVGDE
ncbi:MAG TPA: OB-fold domain-containing protein [Gaiellaceae bacterium]